MHRTASGKVLTAAELEVLVEEAERGYDIAQVDGQFMCNHPDGRQTVLRRRR